MENLTLETPRVSNAAFAGFWLRFVALIIDVILIYVVQIFLIVPLLALFGISITTTPTGLNDADALALYSAMMVPIMMASLVAMAISWLYFALMESGSKQATLGKMAVGIKVTDLEGNRISFLQATGRFFSKIISSMILYIGYIMAAFTEKKQALHDMIAGTLVVSSK